MGRAVLVLGVAVLLGCSPRAETVAIGELTGWVTASGSGPCRADAYAPHHARELADLWNEGSGSARFVLDTYPAPEWAIQLSLGDSVFGLYGAEGWFGTSDHIASLSPARDQGVVSILNDMLSGVDCMGDSTFESWVVLPDDESATRLRALTAGRDHVATQIWIDRRDGPEWTVDREISEFAGRFWTLGLPRAEEVVGGLVLHIEGTNPYDLSQGAWRLTITDGVVEVEAGTQQPSAF